MSPVLRGPSFVVAALVASCSRAPTPAPAPDGSASATTAITATSATIVETAAASASSMAPTAVEDPAATRNVLLITVDSLRADMPWAGYPRAIAPAMTELARTSVVYDRFYSLSSYTAMSVAGMLSGRYPSELDRTGHYFAHWDDGVLFFPELLRKAGIRTTSAQSHFYFDARSGFPKAFDVWELVPGLAEDHETVRGITGPAQLDLALKQLSDEANTKGRFFAWVHFLDPHDKYEAHAGIDYGHATRDLYDGEVTFTDQQIEKLLAFVAKAPWGARTAIVLSADHGEAFGEHAHYFRHGFEIWDVVTHVPLVIHVPGAAPRRIDTPRSAIDLAPTLLALQGLPPDPAMPGKSLVPEIEGKPAEPRDVIIDLPRTTNSDRRRALIRGDFKLVAMSDDDAFQLFDLKNDPGEQRDVQFANREKLEEMKAAYAAASARIPSVCPKPGLKLHGKKNGRPC